MENVKNPNQTVITMSMLENLLNAQKNDSLLTITPEMAAEWLKKSQGNRTIRTYKVHEYAEAMKCGEFTLNNDSICFDEDGVLVNGHHRLLACVESETPFQSYVRFNMPKGSVYDRGAIRSTGDSLYMSRTISKEMSKNEPVALAKRYLCITEIGRAYKNVPDYEIRNFLNENEDGIVTAISISMAGARNPLGKRASVRAAILAALKAGVGVDVLRNFATVCNSGFSNDLNQSAAILLRNYIQNNFGRFNTNDEANKLCAVAQLAIQDFVSETPRKFAYRKLSFPYMPDAKVKFNS